MNTPDHISVSRIIRRISKDVIMPKFRLLDKKSIYKKFSGELVTEIDLKVEEYLVKDLCSLVEGSNFLGEESYENNRDLMKLLALDAPLWVIDPIDGTGNYARGSTCFATMVAYRENKSTIAAWIYDPITDRMISARNGEGTYCNDRPLRVSKEGTTLSTLKGVLGNRLSKRLENLYRSTNKDLPQQVKRYRCCGQEYMSSVLGELNFIQSGEKLKPWDHVAGILIVEEAGFYTAFLEDGARYDISDGTNNGHLLVAPNQTIWMQLRDLLWTG